MIRTAGGTLCIRATTVKSCWNWNFVILLQQQQPRPRWLTIRSTYTATATTTTTTTTLNPKCQSFTPRAAAGYYDMAKASTAGTSRSVGSTTTSARNTQPGNPNHNDLRLSPRPQQQQRRANVLPHPRTTGTIAVACRRRGRTSRVRYCFGCGAQIVHAHANSNTATSHSHQTTTSNSTSRHCSSPSGGTTTSILTRLGAPTSTRTNNYWQRQHWKLRQSQIQNWALCDRCRRLRQHDKQQQQQVLEQHHKKQKTMLRVAEEQEDSSSTTPTEDWEFLQQEQQQQELLLLHEDLSPNHDMVQAFREQVRQIRQTHEAVVIVCVDARNVRGTLLSSSLRKYIGGHAILLAVLRCDLLPSYLLLPTITAATSPAIPNHSLSHHHDTTTVTRPQPPNCSSSSSCSTTTSSSSDNQPNTGRHNNYWEVNPEEEVEDDDIVTRGEPDYHHHHWKRMEELKEYYADRAHALKPAAVFLCSCVGAAAGVAEDPHHSSSMQQQEQQSPWHGLKDLATDLWQHLLGRDCYVVGSANIGKSTLVDTLVAAFLNRGQREGHFRDRRGKHRWHTLQQSRVTTSATVAGTTLQNVRLPCFANHTQALYDTPGLLLEEQLRSIFPMRNLTHWLAQPPQPVVPQFMSTCMHAVEHNNSNNDTSKTVDRTKSFALIITERDDPAWPLLRVEVRLKKQKNSADKDEKGLLQQPPPAVECVWNSLLPGLQMRVLSIEQCRVEEQERAQRVQAEGERREPQQASAPQWTAGTETLAQRREPEPERLREELGSEAYERQRERAAAAFERRRVKMLAKLVPVQEQVVVVAGNGTPPVGVDLAVAHVGWWTFQLPRTALVRTFAPHVGVRAALQPTLGLPASWGPFEPWRDPKNEPEEEDDSDEEEFDEELMLEEELEEYYYGNKYFTADFSDDDEVLSASNEEELRTSYQKARDSHHKLSDDPWTAYRGEAIGWHWDNSLPLALQQWNRIRNKDSNPTTQHTEKRPRRTG